MQLILHLGGPKCGSTAIARFLNVNCENLAKNGVLVPGQGLDPNHPRKGGQSIIFQQAYKHPEKEQFIFEKLTNLRRFMVANGFSKLAFSAEILGNHHNGLSACFQRAAELFDCEVVMYVRRQDDFIASGWKQWGLKEFVSPQEWIDHCLSRDMGDWYKRLQPWRALFGTDSISVRIYDRNRLENGSVVEDFLALTGLAFGNCTIPSAPVNPSIGDTLARLAHRARDVFRDQHDLDLYRVMGALVGDAAYAGCSPTAFVTRTQRMNIVAHYEPSNRLLRQVYFPTLSAGDPLFYESFPDDEPQDELEQLRSENALIFRALYQLAQSREE